MPERESERGLDLGERNDDMRLYACITLLVHMRACVRMRSALAPRARVISIGVGYDLDGFGGGCDLDRRFYLRGCRPGVGCAP